MRPHSERGSSQVRLVKMRSRGNRGDWDVRATEGGRQTPSPVSTRQCRPSAQPCSGHRGPPRTPWLLRTLQSLGMCAKESNFRHTSAKHVPGPSGPGQPGLSLAPSAPTCGAGHTGLFPVSQTGLAPSCLRPVARAAPAAPTVLCPGPRTLLPGHCLLPVGFLHSAHQSLNMTDFVPGSRVMHGRISSDSFVSAS